MPAVKPRKATDPTGVERDDHVYAAHPQHGPMVLKVLAAGKDGFTGEDGAGGRHRIRHDGYLGHKARALHTFNVVDQGVDGALIADERGARRFVGGELPGRPPDAQPPTPPPAPTFNDPLLDGLDVFKKSLWPVQPLPEGLALLFKAVAQGKVGRAGRAGLTLRRSVDRSGRTEGRWVKTNPDQKHPRDPRQAELSMSQKPASNDAGKRDKPPPPLHKHGDTVTFRHGDVEGHGKIVASGQDGVTVQTEDGREHQVRHDALDPPHQYADRQEGEDDKKYLKRTADSIPSPKHLPEEHDRYFNMDQATDTVPIDKLVSGKSDADNAQGGNNSPKFMMAAYHGKVAKRDPITVSKLPDGKYKIEDGNGTFTGVKAAGWKSLPVKVIGDSPQGAGGSAEVVSHFDPAETKGLPDAARQPVATKDELYAKAAEAQALLEEWLNKGKGVAAQLGYEHVKGSPDSADFDSPGGMLFIAPLKGEKRAQEKVDSDYGGDWSQLLDPVRASLAADSYDELGKAMEALKASGMKLARKPKDRFTKPLPVGYRDALLNITLPNGLVGELQLHVKAMLKAKAEGHHHYEVQRTIDAKKEEDISDEDRATRKASIESQTAIYNAAWQQATGQTGQDAETMKKAMAGESFSYFEHDNAKFRRRNVDPDRWSVDDVLHDKTWKPYGGSDKLAPAMYGDEIPDPLGGGGEGATGAPKPDGKTMHKAAALFLKAPTEGDSLYLLKAGAARPVATAPPPPIVVKRQKRGKRKGTHK